MVLQSVDCVGVGVGVGVDVGVGVGAGNGDDGYDDNAGAIW